MNSPFKRLFKKWAELPGALPRHRQKCSLTHPKTYARSAFLTASLHYLENEVSLPVGALPYALCSDTAIAKLAGHRAGRRPSKPCRWR